MPVRKDQTAWTEQEKEIVIADGNSYRPLTGEQLAAKINAEVWGGMRVRTAAGVDRQRMNFRIRLRPAVPEVSATISATNGASPSERLSASLPVTEQKVEREESESGISLRAVGQRIKTVDDLIRHAEIDMSRYEIAKQKANTWDTTMRGADGSIKTVQNFQIWVEVKPKAGPNVQEQVEALIAGAFATRIVKPQLNKSSREIKSKLNSDLMQAVVIADPHLAKYAWSRETGGEDYDLTIASRLVKTAAESLMDWGDEQKPAVRYIMGLGDILHYDTPAGMTTGGTPQDRDTRMGKMLEEAANVLCGLVERSAQTCETRVVMVPGNHDRATSLAMQLILAAYFRNDSRVTVDVEPTHRKYVEWGHCLIGLTHGDTARKRLPTLMQVERKEAWGRSKVREWHHGHLHREAQTVTDGGVTIREHLSLSPPDSWHAIEGYVGAPRGMDSYLYSAKGYLQGTWRSPVLDG